MLLNEKMRYLVSVVLIVGPLACTTSTVDEPVAEVTAAVTDADHDGVPDFRDKCPKTAQVKKVAANFKYRAAVAPERLSPEPMSVPVDADGCELDSDGDGVKDSQDYCVDDSPEAISAGVAPNGCPLQSDGDGTPDYRDKCPGTARGVKTDRFGCPLT